MDTWKGDPHAGFYGEEVFDEVDAYNRAYYSSSSTLLRCTFDEALDGFAEPSIDLLHIDGLHTYEAVSHEFHSWLPKVRPGGIILLHDILGRGNGFGVWKFWEEISSRFQSFEFRHSWGLGVVRVPGPPLPDEQFWRCLFERDPNSQENVRRYYLLLSDQLQYRALIAARQECREVVRVTVYPYFAPGYGEATAVRAPLRVRQWERITLELPQGSQGSIRIDPLELPALVDIAEIQVRNAVDDHLLWRASEAAGFDDLKAAGNVVVLSRENRLRCFSFGIDPQLILPELPREQSAQPLRVDISLWADTELSGLIGCLNGDVLALSARNEILSGELAAARNQLSSDQQLRCASQREISNLQNRISELIDDRDSAAASATALNQELDAQRRRISKLIDERDAVAASVLSLSRELDAQRHEISRVIDERDSLAVAAIPVNQELDAQRHEISKLVSERDSLVAAAVRLNRELDAQRQALDAVWRQVVAFRSSKSWRLTKPLRWGAARLLGRLKSD